MASHHSLSQNLQKQKVSIGNIRPLAEMSFSGGVK